MTHAIKQEDDTSTLALPLPEPETTATESAPVQMSEAQRLELVEQDALLQKEEIRAKTKTILDTAAEINEERIRIEAAIAQAEQRLTLAGGRGHNTARADLLARKMLGEDVDLEQVEAEDPMDAMTATDIQAGLRALKLQLEEVKRRWSNMQSGAKKLESEFAIAHARQWGAKYMAARETMVAGYIQLKAAESIYNGNVPYPSPVFTGLDFDNFCAPSCDNEKAMDPLKMRGRSVGRGTVSGETIRYTAAIQNTTSAIRAEFSSKEA